MRSCLRIPRILIPRDGKTEWSVIASDRYCLDRAYWERIETRVGDSPSTLRFILPEILKDEADEDRLKLMREQMYVALEEDWIVKLTRGFVLTERVLPKGVRRGILAAIDLEAYSAERGERASVRAAEEIDRAALKACLEQRKSAPLEFPHAVVLYRDKRDKVMRGLLKEDLEQLYDFELMEDGGRIRGLFIPEYVACDVALELQSRTDFFAVIEGNAAVAAAKAHWEALKPKISEGERRNHPARFTLVELVNACSETVEVRPVHRIVKGVEPDAFCDFLMRNVKCRRQGNVIYPELPTTAANVAKLDALIERFIRANTGKIEYALGDENLLGVAEDDCAGVMMRPVDKDDLFDEIEEEVFPKHSLTLDGARYYLEGREISYD